MREKIKNLLKRLFGGFKLKTKKKKYDYIELINQLLSIKDIEFSIKDTSENYEINIKSKTTRTKKASE